MVTSSLYNGLFDTVNGIDVLYRFSGSSALSGVYGIGVATGDTITSGLQWRKRLFAKVGEVGFLWILSHSFSRFSGDSYVASIIELEEKLWTIQFVK